MAKILLVEDDNNLREIYEARLQAEGYTIVSAMDGEDALVKAKQEKPDLIISDVMMPRISGFEMLDILRNTEGLKTVKVIMLTALGQAEDKTRADSLGADRYLVKSQVTLEDIVKAADELLAPITAAATPAVSTTTAPVVSPAPQPAGSVQPVPVAVASTVSPATPTAPVTTPAPATPVAAVPVTPAPVIPVATPPAAPVIPAPAVTAPPVATASATPVPAAQPQATPPIASPQPATAPVAAPATPVVATTTPVTPSADEQDDKLIADAVKDLTATLSPPAPTQPVAEATSAPAVPVAAPATPAASQEVAAPAPVTPATPAVVPDATTLAVPPVSAEPTPQAPTTVPETPVSPATPVATPTPSSAPEETAAPTPTAQTAAPTTEEKDVDANLSSSAADEQADMQSQINDYIKQQVLPSESDTNSSAAKPQDAAVTISSEVTSPQPTEADTSNIVMPSVAPVAPDSSNGPTVNRSGTSASLIPASDDGKLSDANKATSIDDDNVSIAHKKVIAPPVEPIKTQPDLQDLLAKEGIGMDDDASPATAHDGTMATPPHQPGHVITPSTPPASDSNATFNPADPNNISL